MTYEEQLRIEKEKKQKLVKLGLSAAGALVLFIIILSCFSIISPGNVGVIFNIWTGNLQTVPQGMAFKIPFVTKVQSYPIALRTYTMVARSTEGSSKDDDSLDLPTREGQHIRQDLSITYNTAPEKADVVFKAFRGADIDDIEASFIRRTVITIAQNVAGQMSLSELISSKRGELQSHIQENLSIELTKMGFNVDKINLGASHLPQAIEKQMQEKMAVQQQALQAEYKLQQETMLAKAAVAKSRGEAEANQILQSSITPKIIELKAIEKWNGILPQVTGGAVPFINLKGPKANE